MNLVDQLQCMHGRTDGNLYGHPLLGSPLTQERPAPGFCSSSKDSSSLCRARQCDDDLVVGAGGAGVASLLVEMPPAASAGNARAEARVAMAEVTTRAKSMLAPITFLIVDVRGGVLSLSKREVAQTPQYVLFQASTHLAQLQLWEFFLIEFGSDSVQVPNYTAWLMLRMLCQNSMSIRVRDRSLQYLQER